MNDKETAAGAFFLLGEYAKEIDSGLDGICKIAFHDDLETERKEVNAAVKKMIMKAFNLDEEK